MGWHLPLHLLSFVLLQKQKPEHKIQSPSFPPCFTPRALKSTTSSGIWWGRPPNIWAFLIHFSLGRDREGGGGGLPTTVPRAHHQLLKHQSLAAGLGGTEWRVGVPAGVGDSVISVPEHQSTCCPTGLEAGRRGLPLEVLGGLVRQGVWKSRELWAELRDGHGEQLH